MVRACIFDLGGTIVDKYSLVPFKSFKSAFKKHNININNNLIFKDMGIEKKQHITNIIHDNYTSRNWFHHYNRFPNSNDIDNIYNDFKLFNDEHAENIDIIPQTKGIINYLRDNNIYIGCTTGFGKSTTNIIAKRLNNNNIYLDSYVSSNCVPKNTLRPNSGMIYKNLNNFNININDRVIKVDDTNVGILEGKKAGCITVGVARWSTYMNAKPDVPIFDIGHRIKTSREKLKESNPDYIIDTLDELITIINYHRFF